MHLCNSIGQENRETFTDLLKSTESPTEVETKKCLSNMSGSISNFMDRVTNDIVDLGSNKAYTLKENNFKIPVTTSGEIS